MKFLAVLVLMIAWLPTVRGQSSDTPGSATRYATEWGFTTGGATDLPGGARGGEFWAMQLRWGKVLTAPYGPGVLRGTFEYAVELVPAMVLRQARFHPSQPSGGIFGGGFNPIVLQWNFTSHDRFVPFFQIAGGTLWTTRDFPHGASSFNFTPQGGIGAYWLAQPNRAISFGVRYHHISNAGLTKPNPGHNAVYFYGGLSWWR